MGNRPVLAVLAVTYVLLSFTAPESPSLHAQGSLPRLVQVHVRLATLAPHAPPVLRPIGTGLEALKRQVLLFTLSRHYRNRGKDEI
jgi:hypothetical protein